jgi:hypothetical protein
MVTMSTHSDDGGQCPYKVSQLFPKGGSDRLNVLARTDTDFAGTDLVEEGGILNQDRRKIGVPQPLGQFVRRCGDYKWRN